MTFRNHYCNYHKNRNKFIYVMSQTFSFKEWLNDLKVTMNYMLENDSKYFETKATVNTGETRDM